jgi:class 3 adenylate cyclase
MKAKSQGSIIGWMSSQPNPSSLWSRISTSGVTHEDSSGERRRLVLTNQSSVIGIVSCGSFAVGYAIAGARFLAPMIGNLAAVGCFVFALALARRGKRTAAKLFLLVPVNLVVVVASLLLGARVGFLYYFFLFGAVAFLLFGSHQRVLRWALAGLSVACTIFTQVAGPLVEAPVPISAMVAEVLDVVSAVAVLGTVVFIVNLFTTDTEVAEAKLEEEHARSERLLLNILPAAISERLKGTEQPIADAFAEVTVLFADIVGFTELSARLDPAALVKMLNGIFSAFDDLAQELGLEKIKTIGDCYMVAAGLPSPRADHGQAVARMALGMRAALERLNEETGTELHIRIGVHSGPVVAGVIGKRKFIYDLWGDTVNTASRMESSGVADQIQVSRAVYDRIKDDFDLDPRGMVKVKGKGEMETFLLKGPR